MRSSTICEKHWSREIGSRFADLAVSGSGIGMPRTGRNPKTGESVSVPGKYVPHFKPGRLLRERVNQGGPAERTAHSSYLEVD